MCNSGDLLSATEAAAMLGLSVHGLNSRRRAGTLPAVLVGGTHIYRRSDIESQPRVGPGQRGPKPLTAKDIS